MSRTVLPAPTYDLSTKSVLVEAEVIINGPRRTTYGSPLESFERVAKLWSALLGIPVTAEQACDMLILFKVARAQGPEWHRDNYVDIAGYAGCAEKIHKERNELAG